MDNENMSKKEQVLKFNIYLFGNKHASLSYQN